MTRLHNLLVSGGLAATALFATAGFAFAEAGHTVSGVNLRSGPGTNYEVIESLPRGEPVTIGTCEADWCQVSVGEASGWAWEPYLATSSVVYSSPPLVPYTYDYPYSGWIGGYQNSLTFGNEENGDHHHGGHFDGGGHGGDHGGGGHGGGGHGGGGGHH